METDLFDTLIKTNIVSNILPASIYIYMYAFHFTLNGGLYNSLEGLNKIYDAVFI